MKHPEIIIDSLTATIDNMRDKTSEYIADLEATNERAGREINKAENDMRVSEAALSLLQAFLSELHPELIVDFVKYVESESEDAYDQDDRYEYGQKALQSLLECTEDENTEYVLKESIEKLSLLQSKLTLSITNRSE